MFKHFPTFFHLMNKSRVLFSVSFFYLKILMNCLHKLNVHDAKLYIFCNIFYNEWFTYTLLMELTAYLNFAIESLDIDSVLVTGINTNCYVISHQNMDFSHHINTHYINIRIQMLIGLNYVIINKGYGSIFLKTHKIYFVYYCIQFVTKK